MTLYRVASDKLEPVQSTSFADERVFERRDLQRLLRHDISPIGNDLMVIAEEFGDWEDSNRRIDLFCLSRDLNLVVVEIKRTEDGGHMELQAVRYAAMVSGLTFEQVVQAHATWTQKDDDTSRISILEFLRVDSGDSVELTGEVRIILVSADFSTELTTAVLWLNEHDLDITCVRLRPYRMQGELLIDATQIIPLPESTDYVVKARKRDKEQRRVVGARQDIFRRFWAQLIERARPRTTLLANRSSTTGHWLPCGIGRVGFNLTLSMVQDESQVECYITLAGSDEEGKAAFRYLLSRRDSIERDYGGELDWQELEGRQGSRICTRFPGGWRSPEAEWSTLQDRMIDSLIRLESALRKPIQDFRVE